jgi:hypothetical protein
MYQIEILPQKVVEPKVMVLKTRLDSKMIRLQVEEMKQKIFRKFYFIKPKNKEITLVNSEKYYEPYIVIGGKYSIDYCRRHAFNLEVRNQTKELYIAGQKFEVLSSTSGDASKQIIKLEGEDYAHYEAEDFFVLDRMRREISLETFSFAPYEQQIEAKSEIDLNFKKIRLSKSEVIDIVRSKIAKRPDDLVEIIKEVFEITENKIVYRPFFEFTFHNKQSNKYGTIRIDGITGEKSIYKFKNEKTNQFLSNLSLETLHEVNTFHTNEFNNKNRPTNNPEISSSQKSNFNDNKPQSFQKRIERRNSDEVKALKFPAYISGEVFMVGNNLTAIIGDMEIPSGATVPDTLVVKGTLRIGDNCHLFKKVKVLGDISVGIGTVIEGDIVSGGNIVLGSNSVVGGSVRASGRIDIHNNVVVGKRLKENLKIPRDSFDLQTIVALEKEETVA